MPEEKKPMRGLTLEDLGKIFTYSNPNDAPDRDATIKLYEDTRDLGLVLAEHVLVNCPPCAERTLAVRKVQEAVMFANAATATQGGVSGYAQEPSFNLQEAMNDSRKRAKIDHG